MERRNVQNQDGYAINSVSYLRYVEINVFNFQYRLISLPDGSPSFTINGIVPSSVFYSDNSTGVNVFLSGNDLIFSTSFGLTIDWTGDNADINLCDAYADKVCGVCGNADGKSNHFK